MKTSLTTRILPKSILKNKINKRNAEFAKQVVIADNVAPETKSVLEANKVALGRIISKKKGSLEFQPVEDGLFKGQTEMTINKTVNMNYLDDIPLCFSYKKPMLKTIIDDTKSSSKEFVKEIKNFVKNQDNNLQEQCFIYKK